MALLDLMVEGKLCTSKGEGRRLIRNGGFSLNQKKVIDEGYLLRSADLIDGEFLLLSVGKKRKLLVKTASS